MLFKKTETMYTPSNSVQKCLFLHALFNPFNLSQCDGYQTNLHFPDYHVYQPICSSLGNYLIIYPLSTFLSAVLSSHRFVGIIYLFYFFLPAYSDLLFMVSFNIWKFLYKRISQSFKAPLQQQQQKAHLLYVLHYKIPRALVLLFSRICLFMTPWTVAHQAPLSMEFSRQEYWSGLPFPTPGIFLSQGLNLRLLHWQALLLCHLESVIIRLLF